MGETLEQFTSNVDKWGALQWFERMVNAFQRRNECVTGAREPLEFETWDLIARSSASRLANDHADEIRAALASEAASQVPADGWQMVPKEPTQAMVEAAWKNAPSGAAIPTWRAMITAAPNQEGPADGK